MTTDRTRRGKDRQLKPRQFNLLLLLLFGLMSCKSTGNESNGASNAIATQLKPTPSNEEIIAAVYNNSYSVPAGFYVDERANTAESYALYHVKDATNSYELCADDLAQAADWEEADNQSRAVNGQYVGTYENNRYFEIIRELTYPDDVGNVAGATSPGFSRIFKCSAIDRDGVDRNLYSGYSGRLNERPLSLHSVREFAEYLWQFEFFSTARPKVLESFSIETPQSFDHTLLIATRINQGFDSCDRIEVVDWVSSVNKSNGNVSRDFRFLFAIEARLVSGVAKEC